VHVMHSGQAIHHAALNSESFREQAKRMARRVRQEHNWPRLTCRPDSSRRSLAEMEAARRRMTTGRSGFTSIVSSFRLLSREPPQYSAHDREEPFPVYEFAVALALRFRRSMIAAFSHVIVRPHVRLSAFDTPRSIWRWMHT
jgi:hypothetical protein